MSNKYAILEECTFPRDNRNFGSNQEILDLLLSGCSLLVLYVSSECLEDSATQYLRFKKDPYSKAFEGSLGFILKTLCSQPKPNSSSQDSSQPQFVFISEEIEPANTSGKPWSKTNIPKILGHRFFIFYRELSNGKKWGTYMKTYIGMNQMEAERRQYEDVLPGEINYKYLMSDDQWLNIAGFVNVLELQNNRDKFLAQSFDDSKNPINPENVFCLDKFLLAECDNINPKQKVLSNYIKTQKNPADGTNRKIFSFPIPSRCKRYTVDQLKKFLRIEIPKVVEEEDIESETKENPHYNHMIDQLMKKGYVKRHPITGKPAFDGDKYKNYIKSLPPDQQEYAFTYDEEGVTEMFRSAMGTGSNNRGSNNHIYWNNKHTKERLNIIEKWKNQCKLPENLNKPEDQLQDMLSVSMLHFIDDCAKHFSYIFSKINEEQSPYKKACIDFFENFKEENQNRFCWKFDKISSNLSLWEDFLCNMMTNLEHVYRVSTVHDKILIIWLCTLNASDPSRSKKFNILNHGAAAKSKSYSCEIGEEWSIPGTAQSYTYKTLRSDTSKGNYDAGITIMHELTRGWMGVSDKIKAKGGAAAAMGGGKIYNNPNFLYF